MKRIYMALTLIAAIFLAFVQYLQSKDQEKEALMEKAAADSARLQLAKIERDGEATQRKLDTVNHLLELAKLQNVHLQEKLELANERIKVMKGLAGAPGVLVEFTYWDNGAVQRYVQVNLYNNSGKEIKVLEFSFGQKLKFQSLVAGEYKLPAILSAGRRMEITAVVNEEELRGLPSLAGVNLELPPRNLAQKYIDRIRSITESSPIAIHYEETETHIRHKSIWWFDKEYSIWMSNNK